MDKYKEIEQLNRQMNRYIAKWTDISQIDRTLIERQIYDRQTIDISMKYRQIYDRQTYLYQIDRSIIDRQIYHRDIDL